MRATRAEVDLDAVAANVRALAETVAPAQLCAVVKADGYGHGSIAVAEAALDAGAAWLAVALVEEGAVLRRSGVEAPILLLSEPRPGDLAAAVRHGLRLTLDTATGIEVAERAAIHQTSPVPVHLKVDTGMHRVGCQPGDAVALARAVHDAPHLELEAVWTHCAVADEPDHPFTDEQLDRFDAVCADLEAADLAPALRHAANSAGGIAHPRSRMDLVRAGISVYGIAPSEALEGRVALCPAMRLVAEVSHVQRVRAGEGVSYGLRRRVERDTVVATVPIGYADGVGRALGVAGTEVLVGGRRCPMVGVVTMDQLMVDCGPDAEVAVGDEVVLLGEQAGHRIGPEDWARTLGTIAYEVVCGIGPRVPRLYQRDRRRRGAGT